MADIEGGMMDKCECGCPYSAHQSTPCDFMADQIVVLVGGPLKVPETPVPMCDPCSAWWRTNEPTRVKRAA